MICVISSAGERRRIWRAWAILEQTNQKTQTKEPCAEWGDREWRRNQNSSSLVNEEDGQLESCEEKVGDVKVKVEEEEKKERVSVL